MYKASVYLSVTFVLLTINVMISRSVFSAVKEIHQTAQGWITRSLLTARQKQNNLQGFKTFIWAFANIY